MKNPNLKLMFVCITLIIVMVITPKTFASSQLSVKAADDSGKPVSDLQLTVSQVDNNRPGVRPPILVPGMGIAHHIITDENGEFKIPDIVPDIQWVLSSMNMNNESEYEFSGIKIGGIDIFVDPQGFQYRGFVFSVAKDAGDIDLDITVKQRMRIRGQVLSADGTPLSNTSVKMEVKQGSGRSSTSKTLDDGGFFKWYLRSPGNYIVNVSYEGKSVESKPLLVEDGQRIDGLVLKFVDEQDQDIIAPKPNRIINRVGGPPPNFAAIRQLQERGVWVIRPESRHAYKKIRSKTIKPAQVIAAEEEAHLVSISSKEEEHWLLEVFGEGNYWMGLKVGAKKWDTGEPVNYTNWLTEQKPNEYDTDNIQYVVLIGNTRKWDVGVDGSPLVKITEYAILEKEHYIPEELEPEIDE